MKTETPKTRVETEAGRWEADLPRGDYVCASLGDCDGRSPRLEEPRVVTTGQCAAHLRAMALLPPPHDDDSTAVRAKVISTWLHKVQPRVAPVKETWLEYCVGEVKRRVDAGGNARVARVTIDGVDTCTVVATGLVFRS